MPRANENDFSAFCSVIERLSSLIFIRFQIYLHGIKNQLAFIDFVWLRSELKILLEVEGERAQCLIAGDANDGTFVILLTSTKCLILFTCYNVALKCLEPTLHPDLAIDWPSSCIIPTYDPVCNYKV